MIGSRHEAMRLLRTVRHLHPLQIATRVPHVAVARAIAFMPGTLAPKSRGGFERAPASLATLADAERARGEARIARLPAGGRLRAYEEAYGLELGTSGDGHRAAWHRRVALEPYPASVRARRLAVALRLGRNGLEPELARACRAVMLQPEVHLLANHLLENGFALACGGAVTRGAEADAWYAVGQTILDWQLGEQFLSDGGHFERTASYHVALVHALLETIELARAGGRSVSDAWLSVARRAIAWMDAVRAPDGTYPLFNDAALDAAPRIDDVRALGVALGLADAQPASVPAALHLPQTGWVLLREEGTMLAFDAGADGAKYQPGHVHADALSVELWVGGERVIVDYGVASYAADEARADSRATRAHNTIEIEGHDSSEVWAAFRVGRRARATLDELRETRDARDERVLIAEATHDGYTFLPRHPRHTRRVELRARELHVSDHVTRDARRRRDDGRIEEPIVLVGRMRLDRAARARRHVAVNAEAGGSLAAKSGVWFPELGVSRAADVFEQRAYLADERAVQSWRIRW